MGKLSVLEVLRGAREKLSRPGAWIRGSFAVSADGVEVESWDPTATCYCALGAIDSLCGNKLALMGGARAALRAEIPLFGIAMFNDQQDTVEPVLDLFDKAIAKLEQEVA